MRIILDIECSTTKINGKTNPSPYLTTNKLVSVGYVDIDTGEHDYFIFKHNELDDDGTIKRENYDKLQNILNKATLIGGHNIKFDMSWLLECGFTHNAELYDTMIAQYVFSKGLKVPLSLDACCERYGLTKKLDVLKTYFAKGLNTNEIPLAELIEYGQQDIASTLELYNKQQELMATEADHIYMKKAVDLMCKTLPSIIDMERNGIHIDLEELDRVEKQYREEYNQLKGKLNTIIVDVMGHTPINLDSSEHLSQIIYSRKVNDKAVWKELFNLGSEVRNSVVKLKYQTRMSEYEFYKVINKNTTKLRKTIAEQCTDCKGYGKIRKFKKNGSEFKKEHICKTCTGAGFLYKETKKYAGLRLSAISSLYAATGGFSTDKVTIAEFLKDDKLSEQAREFLTALLRINAISSYLSTFVEGIRKNTRNNTLHCSFNQCVTATGRLSSSNINCQNMPRNKTFPIRKVFTSRFEGGKLLSVDFKQLEFRVAAILAKDEQATKDILNEVDIHVFTRDTITAAGQPMDRQEAKIRTFKPLFGGVTGTPAEEAYYKAFLAKYKGIDKWQHDLENEALNTKQIKSPSGRIYAFPNVRRMPNGSVLGGTQIKNYPVQGFATGDLSPVAMIELYNRIKNLKSKLMLVVHDDCTFDVHPDEVKEVTQIVKYVFGNFNKFITEYFDLTTEIPIEGEVSIGNNWMDKIAI
jgi:DNA polymerase I-like protein with 3'-5' exonuclease and polymerase domains